jgi:hypothetical protein
MVEHKTASDILSWFENDVAPRLKNRSEVIAHGGTALALRGFKGYTKDVDINISEWPLFDEFCKTLEALGYEKEWDLMARPGTEHNIRYVSNAFGVDIIDLYYPTWNNWSITDTIKRKADILVFGCLNVVLPNLDAIFLFKTYPCRETDITDLKSIQSEASLNAFNIRKLFNEQEAIIRTREDIDPVISIVNLRARFYLSISALLKTPGNKIVKELRDFALSKFKESNLNIDLKKLAKMINAPGMEWEKFIHRNYKKFSKALGFI